MLLRVNTITVEADDVRSFELVDPEGVDLLPFTAGSHVDVIPPGGTVRQYSLCNDPRERHRYLLAVLREPAGRGGSVLMHDRVQVGDLLQVAAPRNHFPLDETADRHLLIAGGIGITPLLAMAHRLHAIGARFAIHYCTRSPERTAFQSELARYAAGDRVQFHHDAGNPADGLDVRALVADVVPGTHVYCCGPGGLMTAVKAATAHWPSSHVHFEYFAVPAIPAATSADADGPFDVEIASTGALYRIPEGQSILSVLTVCGMTLDSSCEAGICGTCQTRYLSGHPDHRDYVLTDDERGEFIMICVSRAAGKLVLDL
jgi:vanillate O-demethylase ferredoxin subunit